MARSSERTAEPVFSSRRAGLLLGAGLFGLTILAFLPALRGGFIWDDDSHLTENPCIVGPLGLREIWSTRAARICPLVQTTWRLEYALWGLHPLPYHLVNILFHAAAAVFLWRLLLRLQLPAAWLGAALWALHPVQVETVAWITELKNTQSGFFFLLTILFFVRSIQFAENRAGPDHPANRYYFLSVLCGLLAMTSKSSTVVLPAVLGLVGWWLNCAWLRREWKRLVPFFFFSAGCALLSIWTQQVEGAGQAEYSRTVLERIATAGKVVWFYLGKLLWPHPLIFIYPRWSIDPAQFATYLPTALLVLCFCLLWWQRRQPYSRPIFFALAYFVVALLPVLGLIDHYFLRYSFVGDHFQYLASMGPLALAAAGFATLFRATKPLLPTLAGTLLLAALGLATWQQCQIYENSEALWRATLARNPASWMALNNLSIIELQRGRPNEAMSSSAEALRLRPTYAEGHVTLGNALLAAHRPDEAISEYEKALDLRFDERVVTPAFTLYNLGNAFLEKGQPAQALIYYEKAVAIHSAFTPDVETNLGNTLLRLGRLEEAVPHFERACALRAYQPKPERARAEYNLANALWQEQRPDQAVVHLQRALQLQPDYADAHNNLGRMLVSRHQLREGIEHYEKAARLQPDSALFQNNLAWQLATSADSALRDGRRALEHATRANQLDQGNDPIALNTLAAAYAEAGQFPQAIETAQRALSLAQSSSDSGLVDFLQKAIALYQSGQPYHQPTP